MLLPALCTLLVLTAAGFLVQRTSRRAEKPGRWSRNGLLGIAAISTLVMAAMMGVNATIAFGMLFAWLPGIVLGILLERWQYGQGTRPR